MSTETGNSIDEKKGREAAEEASALDKLTDRVRGIVYYQYCGTCMARTASHSKEVQASRITVS